MQMSAVDFGTRIFHRLALTYIVLPRIFQHRDAFESMAKRLLSQSLAAVAQFGSAENSGYVYLSLLDCFCFFASFVGCLSGTSKGELTTPETLE